MKPGNYSHESFDLKHAQDGICKHTVRENMKSSHDGEGETSKSCRWMFHSAVDGDLDQS